MSEEDMNRLLDEWLEMCIEDQEKLIEIKGGGLKNGKNDYLLR